jgi:hypothetical protein
VKLKEIP